MDFTYNSSDGLPLYAYEWAPKGVAGALLQISHGMQEHAGRYAVVAQAFCSAGYAVVAGDHRGHGRSLLAPGKFGHLGEGGSEIVLDDMKRLTNIGREKYPGRPVFLYGHSWGSFLAQAYMQRWGEELAGVILGGTNGVAPAMDLVVGLARLIANLRGTDRTAGLLRFVAMNHYNKAFEPGRTGREWLTRDTAEVDRYINDPLCGAPFPNSFFVDHFCLVRDAWKKCNEERIPHQLPVLLFAGTDDPVGLQTRGVRALASRYLRHGIKDVTTKFYPAGRHEMLCETNREEVIADLIAWLDAHCGPGGAKMR